MRDYLNDRLLAAGGWLDFGEYMHISLYAPELGYYVNGRTKFGADGDFTTAPEISPLFGQVVARQLAQSVEYGVIDIVEFGAGSGALAHALLGELAERKREVRYRIVEISPALVALQRERLELLLATPGLDISWLQDTTGVQCDGWILANEVADALPVQRFRCTREGIKALGVERQGEVLALTERPAHTELIARVEHLESTLGLSFPVGYSSEICPALVGWIEGLGKMLGEGQILLSDYGYSRADYYAAERATGTLMCHYRHRAHADALQLPGLQDITAWVDFTAIAEAASAVGLELSGYTTQAQFLLHGGLAELVADQNLSPEAQLVNAAGLKTLTLPGEMGERFRFMALSRGTLPALAGFSGKDLSYTL